MRKFLLLFLITTIGAWSLVAQKLSSPTLNFLQEYETTAPAQRARLKSTYALQENEQGSWVSAYLHLLDENNQTGLDENGVKINAQYGAILSVQIPVENLRTVAQLPSVQYIEIGQRVRPLMSRVRTEDHSNIDKMHQGTNLAQAYTGKDVVIGIIDCGFQYNHINFYDSKGETLRVKRVWDQSINDNPPTGYYYGTEYATPESIVNAQSDYSDESHATHVAGIAAGAYSGLDYKGVAPDADLVFISYNLYDNSSSNTSISDGIKYIYDYAESVGKPCVVNMSLGTHTGPHDGSSTFDRICDQLQGEGKLLVGASGNEGDYNIHVSKQLTSTDKSLKALLSFGNTPAASAKEASIDIWGSAEKPISVRIFVYNKDTNTEVSSSTTYSTEQDKSYTLSNLSGSKGKIYISTTTDPFNKKGNINIYISNIIYTNTTSDYTIGIEVTSEDGSTVHAWVEDYYYIAHFDETDIPGFTSGNDNSTMGEIGGTGKRIISVGAYSSCNYLKHKYSSNYNNSGQTLNDLASFSSLGPTADNRMKPDITAPGTKIVSSFNATACNTQRTTYYQMVTDYTTENGSKYYFGSMEGTSMATPVVTGVLATWLQAFPKLTPELVRKVLKETANTDSYTGNIEGIGNNSWGYGKINAYDGLVECVELAANIDNVIGAPTDPMVYPNPASDYCHVILPTTDKQVKLSVIAPNGTMVYTQILSDIHAGEPIQLDLQGIAPGLYWIQIIGENTQLTTKLVVK